MEKRVDTGLKLKKEGIAIDDDYFYETTGIPKPKHKKKEEPKLKEEPEAKGDIKPKRKDFNFFDNAPVNNAGARPTVKALSTTQRWINRHLRRSLAVSELKLDARNLIEEALREIYNEPEQQEIFNNKLFDISNKSFQHAIDIAIDEDADFLKKNEAYISELRDNTAVWAAFKSHDQTKTMVDLLTDDKGNLRSFREFRKDALKVSKNYNQVWLQTEYNTAVRSARSAANFRKYLENERLYPNLEYVESTAHYQRLEHFDYVGTILPIRHKWWKINLPPNGWNCKCSVKPTRKEVTAVPDGDDSPTEIPLPFRNNPGTSGKLIDHEQTNYYKDVDDEELLKLIEQEAIRLEKRRQKYQKLLKDADYEDVQLNADGGLKATHEHHNFNKQTGKYEKEARDILFGDGYKVILGDERSTLEGVKIPDGTLDDNLFDIGSILGEGKNAIKRNLAHAASKDAKDVVIYFPKKELYSKERVLDGIRAFVGVSDYKFKKIISIVDGEVIVLEMGKLPL
ncbi:MAG: hypothetical protein ACK5JS_06975 [Mangrovibacterium sp.]